MGKLNLFYLDMTYPIEYQGETFLATEMQYMETKKVDKFVFPIWANRKKEPQVKLNVQIVDTVPQYSKFNRIQYCIKALFNKEFHTEFQVLRRSKRLTLKNLIKALCFVAQGEFLAKGFVRYIRGNIPRGSELVLYSYWLHLDAYVAVKTHQELKDTYKIRSLSRCHRFDIYEYVQNGYIPCRDMLLAGLNKVIPISSDAKNYLLNHYSIDPEKIKVSRLGTINQGIRLSPKQKTLKILSCSWMRKVKRNSLIFEAIKDLDFDVEWTHIGVGEEYEQIKAAIENLQKPNVRCKLLGKIPNDAVIEYYRNNDFNIFVNVSASEGVPVSIMEAMSFGKVIIATDVGGSKEVVEENTNGFLLNLDFKIDELKALFQKIYDMDEERYLNMCRESRRIWEDKCDAELNYKYFNKFLIAE
ncbi:glycosyltransferase [Bacillus sp. BRMEA1]|uniref:glycosyltransferase n=1 Tax=Neobacillus endophyticus TaxID=2738405 RepID=UPI001565D8EE|nr:glycosyltransferase [Neobacillus endophyticus]NRD76947.1 glycosyltransferase [Neobacillus endophyticus]